MLETLAEFEEATKDAVCVVDFTAAWCPPCQMIGPKFVELAEGGEYPNVAFHMVDVDANAEAAEKAGIEAMPTFLFYKGGAKVDELKGANLDTLKAKCAALNK